MLKLVFCCYHNHNSIVLRGERDTVMKYIIFPFPDVFWKFKCKWEVGCNIIKLCNIINSLYFDLVRIAIAR